MDQEDPAGPSPSQITGSALFREENLDNLDGLFMFDNCSADFWQCDGRPTSPSAYRSPSQEHTPVSLCGFAHVHGPRPGSADLDRRAQSRVLVRSRVLLNCFLVLETSRGPAEATSREQMLSDADFENTFGMTKENFGKLPAWKKGQKKREVGLF